MKDKKGSRQRGGYPRESGVVEIKAEGNFKEGVQHCQAPQGQEKCWYMSIELSS